MNINMKKVLKTAGALCVATGVAAASALVASGAAVGALTEGFKSARSAMQNVLNSHKQDNAAEAAEENQ